MSRDSYGTPRCDAYRDKVSAVEITKHPLREFTDLLEFAKGLERELAMRLKQLDTHIAEIDQLRQCGPNERQQAIEECAAVCDGMADRARDVWEAFVAKCRENPDNIGSGSQSWHQYFEACAEAIRRIPATGTPSKEQV